MESGLDGRNNIVKNPYLCLVVIVSMESGLDGRNNIPGGTGLLNKVTCLNGVRPRWPEQ